MVGAGGGLKYLLEPLVNSEPAGAVLIALGLRQGFANRLCSCLSMS